MVRIEIDLKEDMEKIIQEEVRKELEQQGLLRYIRNCVKYEFQNCAINKRVKINCSTLTGLKNKINKMGVTK